MGSSFLISGRAATTLSAYYPFVPDDHSDAAGGSSIGSDTLTQWAELIRFLWMARGVQTGKEKHQSVEDDGFDSITRECCIPVSFNKKTCWFVLRRYSDATW